MIDVLETASSWLSL